MVLCQVVLVTSKLMINELNYEGNILILDKAIKTSLENGDLGLISPDLDCFKNEIRIELS